MREDKKGPNCTNVPSVRVDGHCHSSSLKVCVRVPTMIDVIDTRVIVVKISGWNFPKLTEEKLEKGVKSNIIRTCRLMDNGTERAEGR